MWSKTSEQMSSSVNNLCSSSSWQAHMLSGLSNTWVQYLQWKSLHSKSRKFKIFDLFSHMTRTRCLTATWTFLCRLNFQFCPSSKVHGFSAVDLKPNGDDEVKMPRSKLLMWMEISSRKFAHFTRVHWVFSVCIDGVHGECRRVRGVDVWLLYAHWHPETDGGLQR